jgi:hypothetical protein
METDTRVDGLIDRWEERHQRGAPLTIQELCADCPELIAEVRRRIAALRAMDSALDTAGTVCLPTPEAQAGSQDAGVRRGLPEREPLSRWLKSERQVGFLSKLPRQERWSSTSPTRQRVHGSSLRHALAGASGW